MNKTKSESKVLDFVQRYSLISPEELVVVGVSGGADSVCLLHLLSKCRRELGVKLHTAHLNHLLRGAESEADAKYVSDLADSLGIPITIDKQDVAIYRIERKCSIEEAARELRYAFLGRVAKEAGANRIAIGHTRDDHVETILMHILRGTGINGLCGLAPCSPMAYARQEMSLSTEIPSVAKEQRNNLPVIRPLLDITREETAIYCKENQLTPRIDSSNLSLLSLRNRIRLQLLPLLKQYNPNLDQALLRLADIARADIAFIEQQASELWDEVARQGNNTIYLNKKRLTSLPIALQRQLLITAMTRLIGDARDIEATHIEAARSLLSKPASKRISLPRGLICQGGYDEIVIASPPSLNVSEASQSQFPPCPFPPLPSEVPIKVPGKTVFQGWKITASIVREPTDSASSQYDPGAKEETCKGTIVADFDLHKTGTNLCVRQRRPGDRFQPLGLNTPKKLYEFMVDAKIPRSWRGNIPIVCSSQQIIWVVGWRTDDRVKVTKASREILRLEFVESE
ncbi:MAG: tRNA lysidine(34) synthetase TilS [Dehalococcoidia bacterium]|jgi:tRNA(Ile)-lysidine synthase